MLDEYFALYDGIDHYEHSVSEEAYEVWVRSRLRLLAETGGVHPRHVEAVVDSLRAAEALGTDPSDIVFVGDSWEPDVRGPRRVGMTAVHVWRDEERRSRVAPALEPGDYRVGDLQGVLRVLELRADADLHLAGDVG